MLRRIPALIAFVAIVAVVAVARRVLARSATPDLCRPTA